MAAKKTNTSEKNILITGVTSSIGRNIVGELIDDSNVGFIYGVGKEMDPYYFKNMDRQKFFYHNCNILKYRDLKNLFRSNTFRAAKINTVVHLAFHNSQMRGEDVHQLNVIGTKNLIQSCIDAKSVNKFVFKSSDIVYKLLPHNPIQLDEKADLNFDPDADQWIKDRVDADMICRSYMDNKNMKIIILRMANIVSRNISSPLNSYFDSRPIIKTMGFNPSINLLHMKDVIQAIHLAINKNVNGIYNIGGQDTLPITAIANLSHKTIISVPEPLLQPLNWVQRKLGLSKYYYSVDKYRQKYTALLDISKAKRELGFEPQNRIEF